MKIRRKSEKTAQSVDGVPPLHTLITCTYQKLFKKDAVGGGADHGALAGNGGHGTSEPKAPHRHDSRGSSWSNGRVREAKVESEEAHLGGRRDGHDDSPQNLHEARTNPLLPKRRKVKSTRYAEFSDKFSEEMMNVTPHTTTKAEKRSRNMERANFTGEADMNAVTNSKEALIASIFYVFDTLGTSGLTASEVVAIMLEQSLPGLKEGGARHTVQVANVLRRSRHFISVGNKRYLPCSVAEGDPVDLRHEVKNKPGRSGGHASKGNTNGRAVPVCKLYDGSGWFCPRDAHAGFSLCVHHLDMINRPPGNTTMCPIKLHHTTPMNNVVDAFPSPQHESDSDHDDSDDIGPATLAKWGRDRTPGSAPNQKRKMLSLCSIK